MHATISWSDFERVELRVGTILEARNFRSTQACMEDAHRLRSRNWYRVSSAQITALYTREELIGRQVIAVVNFPPKQIGPFRSEVLVTGFHDEQGRIVLAMPERRVPNGAKLCDP